MRGLMGCGPHDGGQGRYGSLFPHCRAALDRMPGNVSKQDIWRKYGRTTASKAGIEVSFLIARLRAIGPMPTSGNKTAGVNTKYVARSRAG